MDRVRKVLRGGDQIALGLDPARRARPILAGERIHVIGAAGAGASAAALLARHAGADVSACDPGAPSPYTQALDAAGLRIHPEHLPDHVSGVGGRRVDRLAVTKALTAVDPDHPELRAARALGLPVEAWQQVIADAAATHGGRLIGVAGTHGKSTTSGWLVHLLVEAGRDPAAFVGALMRLPAPPGLPSGALAGPPSTGRWGDGDVFVVEADEYAGNFDPYRPSVAVLINAEWDHPDVFADEAAVLAAFERWIRAADGAGEPPILVANAGDPGVEKVLDRLVDWPGRLLAFALVGASGGRVEGFARGLRDRYRTALGPADTLLARRTGTDAQGTSIEIHGLLPDRLVAARVRLPGWHTLHDALAVAGAAAAVGVDAAAIARGLTSFAGVGRRLELKGEAAGVVVLDDYGHHPTAIAATLEGVRQAYPGRRVWAVYEPLTYHRTAALLEPFADVLARADRVAIAEIWAGRDPDTSITSASELAAAVASRAPATRAAAPGTVEETAEWLSREVAAGDAVLVMGGGRSYVIAEQLLERLRARPGTGRRRGGLAAGREAVRPDHAG
jgi:UDP-N-acetylmuramate--alanine ligase